MLNQQGEEFIKTGGIYRSGGVRVNQLGLVPSADVCVCVKIFLDQQVR